MSDDNFKFHIFAMRFAVYENRHTQTLLPNGFCRLSCQHSRNYLLTILKNGLHDKGRMGKTIEKTLQQIPNSAMNIYRMLSPQLSNANFQCVNSISMGSESHELFTYFNLSSCFVTRSE